MFATGACLLVSPIASCGSRGREEIDEHAADGTGDAVGRPVVEGIGALEPVKPWASVDPAFQPDAVRQELSDLGSACDGSVGVVKLDCDEYPCISWSRPSWDACSPRGNLLGGAPIGPDGLPEIRFAVHAAKDDVYALDHRIHWRISRALGVSPEITMELGARKGPGSGASSSEYGL